MVWAESACPCWVSNEADNQEVGGLKQVVDAYRVSHRVLWGCHGSLMKEDSKKQGQNCLQSPLCLQPWGQVGFGKVHDPYGSVAAHGPCGAALSSDKRTSRQLYLKGLSKTDFPLLATLFTSGPANGGNCYSAIGQHTADMLQGILIGWGNTIFSWEWINFFWSFPATAGTCRRALTKSEVFLVEILIFR